MRRAKEKRRRLFMKGCICLVLALVCLSGGLFVHHLSKAAAPAGVSSADLETIRAVPNEALSAVQSVLTPNEAVIQAQNVPEGMDAETFEKLRAQSLVPSDHQIRDYALLLDAGRYDSDILNYYLNDSDRYEFVSAWPEREDAKYQTPAETIGDVDLNTVPLLLQWDTRWGYQPYSQMVIYIAGCAPTSMSMVSSYLLKDPTLTPRRLADLSVSYGDAVDGAGTDDAFFGHAAAELGLHIEDIPADTSSLLLALQEGKPVIMRMMPGHFTQVGHFIVITGVDENGMLIVNDPNSISRSNERWDPQTVVDEAYWGWAFSNPQAETPVENSFEEAAEPEESVIPFESEAEHG